MDNNDIFGTVWWANEDLENALETCSVPATEENVCALRNALEHHSFTDCMISAGWDFIYGMINTLGLKEGESENAE